MKTTIFTAKENAAAAIELAKSTVAVNQIRPRRFQKIMLENKGAINKFIPYPPVGDGMERKNPLVVALGDSVTAGHFECAGNPEELYGKIERGDWQIGDVLEIIDVRESYPEKFRNALIDLYEETSVSIINSGIAGDTIIGMNRRLYRDVIRYQPDLVLINASLNWPEECGGNDIYEKYLRETVVTIINETNADIILMTPNMAVSMPEIPENPLSSLDDRVEIIRRLACEQKVSLADTYLIWETYQKNGYSIHDLLANGVNHPTTTGHDIYAWVLMQLFERKG